MAAYETAGESDEWYTPKYIFDALGETFDMDVAAPWFQEYAPRADAILWVSPKIKFERPDGTRGEWPGTGTALFAAGQRAKTALIRSRLGFVTEPVKVLECVS